MISISTSVSNITGNIIIKTQNHQMSQMREKKARLTKTETLDGGVHIENNGYSDGDQTFSIIAKITREQDETITNIFENYIDAVLSNADGVFYGAISYLKIKNDVMTLTFEVKQKDSI